MTDKNPFRLNLAEIEQKSSGTLKKVVSLIKPFESSLEKWTSLQALAEQYDLAKSQGINSSNFPEVALEMLNIKYSISAEELSKIPKTGPVVIVANHPFGGIEGIILINILKRVRPDFKVLANFILGRVEELKDNFILVDPFGSKSSTRKNTQPLRDSIDYLKSGGLLATFPSGAVSHLQLKLRQVADPDWNTNIARITRKAGATVVPLFFEGHNGPLFQTAGLIHPLLRTLMIPRELYNKRGKEITVRVGSEISTAKLKQFKNDTEVLNYLRLRTYLLGSQQHHLKLDKKKKLSKSSSGTNRILEPIVPEVDSSLTSREVSSLPLEQILVESGDFSVIYADADQIPFCLREIGRLREITFRKVSEGSGKSIDLDGFDNYYKHLFIWDKSQDKIVGAYRLGSVGDILEKYGISGLYTSTLFAYKKSLLEQLCPALEMGRSFIREEYQKNYLSLQLLWRGIGSYVGKFPDYKILFGTVSISSEYNSVSQMLITSFLKDNSFIPEFANLIKARNPHKPHPLKGVNSKETSVLVKDLKDVNELIAEIEAKNHSIPVLLRQYLKLGGKLLGFNIDNSFGDVLDGLIYVDLRETDIKMLEKYFGKEEALQFLKYHGKK